MSGGEDDRRLPKTKSTISRANPPNSGGYMYPDHGGGNRAGLIDRYSSHTIGTMTPNGDAGLNDSVNSQPGKLGSASFNPSGPQGGGALTRAAALLKS